MKALDIVIKFILEKFWPWFKAFVWPYIKDHVADLISFAIEMMKKMMKKFFEEKSESRQQEASQKAQDAEKNANNSPDIHEAEKYRAIAQIWREVFEQYRRDNEDLKRKLDEFEAEAKRNSSAMVDKMDMDVDFSKEQPVLKIGDEIKILPTLIE